MSDIGDAEPVTDLSARDDAVKHDGVRTLRWTGLMLIVYFNTVGGAFGIEPAVGAAGPMLTLLGVVIVGIIWAAPQALMAAELALLCEADGNGGNLHWITRAFGYGPSFVNGMNMFVQNFLANAMVLLLFPSYWPSKLSSVAAGALMAVVAVVFAVVNVLGTRLVNRLNTAFAPLAFAPFFVVYLVAQLLGKADASLVLAFTTVPAARQIKTSIFLSVLLWCCNGQDCCGSVAGEVLGGRAAYLKGLAGAIVLGALTYIVPLVLFYTLLPDWQAWGEGELVRVGYHVSGGCGLAMVLTAMVSSGGMYSSCVFPTARVVAAAAQVDDPLRQLMPSVLGSSRRAASGEQTPVAAIVFVSLVHWTLALLPYDLLAEGYLLFRIINLGFEYAALVALRVKEPHAHRPFIIPGGMYMLGVLVGPVVLVMIVMLATASKLSITVGLVAQPVFLLAYWLRRRATAAGQASIVQHEPLVVVEHEHEHEYEHEFESEHEHEPVANADGV